jgi:hypothetical protein
MSRKLLGLTFDNLMWGNQVQPDSICLNVFYPHLLYRSQSSPHSFGLNIVIRYCGVYLNFPLSLSCTSLAKAIRSEKHQMH